MYIQVMTFRLSPNETEEASAFCKHAILGLSEFDGYVSDTCLTEADSDVFGGMIAWRDWMSLEAFRHSELYAKLQMSPHFDEVNDRAFGVADGDTGTALQRELLAVA